MQTNKKSIRKDKDVKHSSNYVNLIFVIAPDIPTSEVTALECHYAEALNDSRYTVVTNYDVATVNMCWDRKIEFLSINAPGIPTSEVKMLKKKVKRAIALAHKTKRPAFVVTNYNLALETRPSNGVVVN
jgi:hypothetical protein